VKHLPDGSVFLSRHADVAVCYHDPRMRSDKKAEFGPKFGIGTPLYLHHTTSLVFNDPPLHTRVRKLLAAAFTPRALAEMRPRIETIVDGLIERHADSRHMDLVEDFAFCLPVEVICDMLSVPAGNAAVSDFSTCLDTLGAERARRRADDHDILDTLIHGTRSASSATTVSSGSNMPSALRSSRPHGAHSPPRAACRRRLVFPAPTALG
jgi:cytochrome P450